MCGITGIIKKNKEIINPDELKVMNDLISHRGPDGEGYYIEKNVGLGHRRLAILDLSERGDQPMQYNNDYVISFNGEIYNYLELRDELKAIGYSFTSGTDTEVILASYQEWKGDCVQHFNGMWSFAILDRKKNLVFLSRDRFGIKPLYYFENDSGFFWGSEIKQLLLHLPEKKVNRQILFDYLYLGYHHHNDETFFKQIYSLDPGTNLTFDLTRLSYNKNCYYKLLINKEFRNLSFGTAQKLFEKTINNAISLRLRSDVRVGTCLSGGLDSSYIATIAAKMYGEENGKFTAITAKSIETKTDESNYAKTVSVSANLNWIITEPKVDDFLNIAEKVIRIQEEPFGSPSIIMQYFVMEAAKREGCIVMLDGQGGDESLLGYDRYYAAYLNQQKGIFNWIREFFSITNNSGLSKTKLLLYNLYFNSINIRALRQKRKHRYVKPAYREYLNTNLLKSIAKASKNISQLQEHEIRRVQLQKLLKYEDRNSMAHSIEARVPFVDYKLIELAYSLPFSYKMFEGWSKYILRKTASGKLPDDIVWRKVKFGFEAPTDKWLSDKAPLIEKIKTSEFINEFIDSEKIYDSIDNISLWKLYNIAVWANVFDVKF